MAHKRQGQSTGSEKSHHDKHTGQQAQQKEKKKQNDSWMPKQETNAEREARLARLRGQK